MKEVNFSLRPCPGTGLLPEIEISGAIRREGDSLAIGYRLSGALGEIGIPAPEIRPRRRIGLWEDTCLEFFIGEPASPRYWEFNLSPSGEWNAFRFEHYRQGLYEEMVFPVLPFAGRRKSSRAFHLSLEFDLGRIIQAHRDIEMAVSAVLKMKSGPETLWALTHPDSGPDFHHRSGFLIRL
jgi:hypothetical protein